MSEYDYDDRYRSGRRSRYKEPEYVSETTYVERGGAGPLVYRGREDSIEDIPRDFPPPGAEYRRTKYRETYAPRARSSRGYEDDYYSEYGHGRRARSRGRDDGYYSDDYERPRAHRRKSIGDHLKDLGEDLGLGGVVAAVAGRSSRSRSRHRSDRYDRDRDSRRSRSRSHSGERHRSGKKWEQAAKAAIVAGAVEAFRSRKEPGSWTGAKGGRVATAALGAAGIDGLVDKDPERHSKRHIAESVIGGLVTSRLANGPRSRSQSRGRAASRSRSRSRSIFGRSQSRGRERSKSRLREVAGAGAVLAAGKALYDRVRSKSRSRKEQRSRSRSASADSYVPSRGRRYDRSRGFDDDKNQASDRDAAGPGVAERSGENQKGGRSSSTSSESTTDMENRRKKMRAPVYPTTYMDGNPYAAGAVPPPPIGAPPARY